MAVIRVEKTKNYTVMSNHHLRNKELSLKAKGLMSFMLSLPDDWDYSVKGLVSCLKEGKDGIQAALHELEKCGYLHREQGRTASGKLSSAIYTLREIPLTENPHTAKPLAENPPQINTKVTNKEEISIEKKDDDDEKRAEWLKVLKTYQDNINPAMGGWELESLGDLFDSFGSKWVVDAIGEAVEHNARCLRYITVTLEQWHRDGYKVDKRKKGAQPSKKKDKPNQNDFDKAKADLARRLNSEGSNEDLRASG